MANINVSMVYSWGGEHLKPVFYGYHYCLKHWIQIVEEQIKPFILDLLETATLKVHLKEEQGYILKNLKEAEK